MKKLSLFLVFAGLALAQYTTVPSSSYPALDSVLNGKPAYSLQSGAPVSSCVTGKEINTNTANGDLYLCGPSGWLLKGAVGATGPAGPAGPAPAGTGFLSVTGGLLNFPRVLLPADLPLPAVSTVGGVQSKDCSGLPGHVQKINTDGTVTCSADAGSGGGGILTLATGAGAPSGSCAAPSTSNLAEYFDSTNSDIWLCTASATWKKYLSTPGTGAYSVTGAVGTAGANPAAGAVKCYFDSTSLTQICLDTSGNAFTMVKGASAVTHQFVAYTDALGIQHQAQPAFADLSGVPSTFTPAAHASTHAAAGADPVTLTEAQVTSLVADLAAKAGLASPALTGVPTAPTAAPGTSTTQLATAAFVAAAVAAVGGGGGIGPPIVAVWFGTSYSFPATSTNYFAPVGGAGGIYGPAIISSELFTQTPNQHARTFTNMCLTTYGQQDAGGTLTLTLRDIPSFQASGSDSTLTVTFTNATTGTTTNSRCSSGTYALAAGHYWDIKVVNTASVISTAPILFAIDAY